MVGESGESSGRNVGNWTQGEKRGRASESGLGREILLSARAGATDRLAPEKRAVVSPCPGEYEYTFIGNLPGGYSPDMFEHVKVVEPLTSENLAPVLRDHDIYIAASELEPCSNALLEALNSGLPTIFRDGSGHNELARETL
eukprot:1179653-Prorocentrum_minimum.AAC.9